MNKWLGVVAAIVAPTTLITALCYYFGAVSTYAYFEYFGIGASALGFTTQYYVLGSVAVLFPLLVVLPATVCIALWVVAYGRRALRTRLRSRHIRRAGWAVTATGIVLTALSVWFISGVASPEVNATLIPVALGSGAVLVAVGTEVLTKVRSGDAPRYATSAELFTLLFSAATLVLALFWGANIYATAYGEARAVEKAAGLWDTDNTVVLETADPLAIPSNLVKATALGVDPTHRFRYRYECLRTIAVQPDQWILVPARWTVTYGNAVIVPVDEYSRLNVVRRSLPAGVSPMDWNADGMRWPCPEVGPR